MPEVIEQLLERRPVETPAEQKLATVAVVGLGYVGLPGAVATAELMEAKEFRATHYPADLAQADFIIVAVPTPINAARQPDLSPLESASETVGRYLKPGAVVVYESTVYPGATEEVCVPILEKASGMRWKQDFHVGYSPERINPGDKRHTFTKITKVVSGDDAATLEKVSELYSSVVTAGVYKASSIRVAEAAKV